MLKSYFFACKNIDWIMCSDSWVSLIWHEYRLQISSLLKYWDFQFLWFKHFVVYEKAFLFHQKDSFQLLTRLYEDNMNLSSLKWIYVLKMLCHLFCRLHFNVVEMFEEEGVAESFKSHLNETWNNIKTFFIILVTINVTRYATHAPNVEPALIKNCKSLLHTFLQGVEL